VDYSIGFVAYGKLKIAALPDIAIKNIIEYPFINLITSLRGSK
jgi:hypothetical protein